MEIIVKKLWGENVAELIKSSENIISGFSLGQKQVVVVSAIRGKVFNTTDVLIAIWKELSEKVPNKWQLEFRQKQLLHIHQSVLEETGVIQ